MRFKNKHVLITGSTRGIGKAIADAFAQEGATVFIVGRQDESVAKTAAEFTNAGSKAEGYPCDVTNLKNVQKIVNKILDKYKGIDILVNNAGITRDNVLLRMSEDDWNTVMDINLRGVFNVTKVVSKGMLKAKSGKIINLSSVVGITGNIGQANYCASKAGVIGFTKSIALEYASRGIRVNAIAPGYIETDMTDEMKDQAREDIIKDIPMKRLGSINDIAAACLFLASDEAKYITGQTLVVDGGMAI